MKTNLLHHVCSGRRGTKRKAEVQVEEEKPSVEEEVEKGEEENDQQGQRVVIEHWWATSWLNTFAYILLITHFHEAFNTFKIYSTVKVFKIIPSLSAFTECIVIPDCDFTYEQPYHPGFWFQVCFLLFEFPFHFFISLILEIRNTVY